ncbi:MAG TPA: DUF1830 domain-containing protein [Stenomitos sp.]
MAQLIDPVPSNESNYICCCYVNATNKIQVARITNLPNWYFERVVFPGQRLLFEALPAGNLEIHTGMMASAILSDTIPCSQLEVTQDDIVDTHYSAEEEQLLEANNEGRGHGPSRSSFSGESLRTGPLKFEVAQVL